MLVLEYKIKANIQQQKAINEAIRTTQFVRNKCLRFWMDSPKDSKINGFALNKYSTELRNEFPFVKELNSMAVQAAAERAWFAIARFFDNCTAFCGGIIPPQTRLKKAIKGKKGFPKFQKDNRSVEYKTSGFKLHPTKRKITFTDKKGIGEVKLLGKWNIHTFDLKQIKRVRIIRRADGFYCHERFGGEGFLPKLSQFCVDSDNKKQLSPTGSQVGIDVGLEVFYADSNGNLEPNPRFAKKATSKVKLHQQNVSRKNKGSANRLKARKTLAKTHLKVSRQREEYAKRLALRLCQSNDLIAYEALNVKGMVKGLFSKSISDVGWGLFLKWLNYFAAKLGRKTVAVNPRGTSQRCSSCSTINTKTLAQRTHRCSCGLVINRDVNAAINILKLSTQGRARISSLWRGNLYSTW